MNTFVANHLQPALAASGLSARIMAPEVSFYSNFDNAWGFPLLNDPGMRAAVSIVATHGYGRTDNFSTPCNSCAQYNKPIWQTEDSNLDGRYNGSIDDGLTWSTEINKALNGFFRCVYDHRACEISGDGRRLMALSKDRVSTTCDSGWVRSRFDPPAIAGGTDLVQTKSLLCAGK